MYSDRNQTADDGSSRIGRRGFLALSGLVAGGSALGGLGSVSAAPVGERLFETPRWSGFRSILPVDDGALLSGIRTNSRDEQVGWAVKLDDDLDVVWNNSYLSPRHLQATDSGEHHDGIELALSHDDGGYLLVGWWHTLGADSRHGWLTRIGDDGIPWWSHVYNRDGFNSFRDDFADGVVTDDGFLLVGRTIADEFLDENRGDGWVVEIDSQYGWVLQDRAYDPNGISDGWADDEHHSEFNAVVSVDDGYLLVGETSPDGPTSSTNTAAWALRIDDEWEPLWSRTYRLDPEQNNEFRDVAAVDDGFLVAGVAGTESVVDALHDFQMDGQSWAAKLDEQGALVWEDSPEGDGLHAVEPAGNGGVFVGQRDDHGWIVAYDEDGNQVGSDQSSIAGSEYFDLAARGQNAQHEYLPVGYGQGSSSTSGLLSRFAGTDLGSGGDDGDDDAADERLFEIVATERGKIRYEFTVDGDVKPAHVNDQIKTEHSDKIRENDDGTVTVKGSTGNPGYGDAFHITGTITSFETRGNVDFFLRLDGERVTVDELVDEDDSDDDAADERLFEIVATEQGKIRYEFTVDGDVEPARVDGHIKAEHSDKIRENGDGTVTVKGSTGNPGYGDAFYITGTITDFESRGRVDFYLRLDGDRVSVDELVDD